MSVTQYGDTPEEYLASDSEMLCLNLANTVDWHASDHPVEMLNTYSDLLTWAVHYKVITPERAERLWQGSQQHPDLAKATLARARALRETIYRIFRAIAHNEVVDDDDVRILNETVQQPLGYLGVARVDSAFEWQWHDGGDDLDQMLWPVVYSAMRLLTAEDLSRVGQCADDRGCGWLFYDRSRNRSRRWCSMETCGNRAKSARFHDRSSDDQACQKT